MSGMCWIRCLAGVQCHARIDLMPKALVCRTFLQAATASSFAVGVDTVQQLIEFLMPQRSQPQQPQPPAQPAGQQQQQQQPAAQPQAPLPRPASAGGLLTEYEKEVFGSGGGTGGSSTAAAAGQTPPPQQQQQQQQQPLAAAATAGEAVVIAGGMAAQQGRHVSSRLRSWLRHRLRCTACFMLLDVPCLGVVCFRAPASLC